MSADERHARYVAAYRERFGREPRRTPFYVPNPRPSDVAL